MMEAINWSHMLIVLVVVGLLYWCYKSGGWGL